MSKLSELSCKDCKERYVNCHASCIKYSQWKEEWERHKDWQRKELVPRFEVFNRRRIAIENAIRKNR